MHQSVLYAIDPGKLSGVCIFYGQILHTAYILPSENRYTWLRTWSNILCPGDTVVVEDYVGARLTNDAKDALKLIGFIEYVCQLGLGHAPIYQRAQARLPFLPKAKELVRGLALEEKRMQHHYDCVAHGLAYLARQYEA